MTVGLQVVDGVVVNAAKFKSADDLSDGWVEQEDGAGMGWTYDGSSFTAPVITLPDYAADEAATALNAEYAAAMSKLRNGYTQEEVNTFAAKESSARARLNGTDDALDRVTLAKFEGLINGTLPASMAEVVALDEGFDAAALAQIDERANKIMAAIFTFRFFSGEIERLRNLRWDELKDAPDRRAVVEALKADYAALGGA